jgi:NADPH:quinone reductase-like Zn-dependent oxidoreductase
MTFEDAAAVPSAAITALQGLRDQAQIQPGQKVLINGASGSVGTYAVQIAKALGAVVTAVCSTQHVERVRSLGADHVIDYRLEDYTQTDHRYDVILDAAAYRSLAENQRVLAPKGVYVLVGGSGGRFLEAMVLGPWRSKKTGQRFSTFVKHPTQQHLMFVKELLEAGSVAPVIDRCYPLPATAEAIRYLEAGHTQGKVVITLDEARA